MSPHIKAELGTHTCETIKNKNQKLHNAQTTTGGDTQAMSHTVRAIKFKKEVKNEIKQGCKQTKTAGNNLMPGVMGKLEGGVHMVRADNESQAADECTWVACDECDKWRRLPAWFRVPGKDEPFVCCMITQVTCKTAEEQGEEHTGVSVAALGCGGARGRVTGVKVASVDGVLCTEFSEGMWNKTNSLKVLLEGFERKGLVAVSLDSAHHTFPFFTVNGKKFSALRVCNPDLVYETFCEYICRSPFFMKHGEFSKHPDGRLFNLFNDLGFKSKLSTQFFTENTKAKKDFYWWDMVTWNKNKAVRSVCNARNKHTQPQLVPDHTKVFPAKFYQFGSDTFKDGVEEKLVNGIVANV